MRAFDDNGVYSEYAGDDVPAWAVSMTPCEVRVAPLAQLQTAAVAKTYSDVDGVYAAAVGIREHEYLQAETDARAFKASGYAGTPTAYVSGWATVKGLTNQQSADAIIARADALQVAMLAMRNQRFVSQKAMTDAASPEALSMVVAEWNAFIAATRAGLGL